MALVFAGALGFRSQHGPLLFDPSPLAPFGEQRGGGSRPVGGIWRRDDSGALPSGQPIVQPKGRAHGDGAAGGPRVSYSMVAGSSQLCAAGIVAHVVNVAVGFRAAGRTRARPLGRLHRAVCSGVLLPLIRGVCHRRTVALDYS